MKRTIPVLLCCLLIVTAAVAAVAPAFAQLAAPNASGVSLGAVYFTVPDVDKHRKIWVDIFGAKPVMVGKTEMLKMPGVFIVLTKGNPEAGATLVDHLGIWAKDLEPLRAKLTAAGIDTKPKAQFVNLPDGAKLEFIDDPNGPELPAAHHIHYFIPGQPDGATARAWYIKNFGAAEDSRRNGAVPSARFTAADKWISLDFTAQAPRGGAAPQSSNKGKVLDRFALEVKGIDAFVKKLEADGVKVTKPVSTNADGLKTAMIVDVLGEDIELVEGLSGR